MDKVQERFLYFNAQADKELAKYPQICELEKRTNIPKTYMAAGVVTFVFTLIFFNVWGELLSDVIGWLYPAYASFKAIESPEKEDDVQWLTYWAYEGGIDDKLKNLKDKIEDATKEAVKNIADVTNKSEHVE
ncbi:17757_t:CDS:2 [Gigaspora margarita]|uniref:17757_t:CDS:1 n=1 Tax=Gigaspora margarita TaxID=4874 RepID=A0ABN7VAG4_GIGMA|nr:17757_t:CDS:2 [Gigaspora margarita]